MSGLNFSINIASKGGNSKDFQNKKTKARPKGEARTEPETKPTSKACGQDPC